MKQLVYLWAKIAVGNLQMGQFWLNSALLVLCYKVVDIYVIIYIMCKIDMFEVDCTVLNTVPSYERHGASHHRQFDCLFKYSSHAHKNSMLLAIGPLRGDPLVNWLPYAEALKGLMS